MFRPAAIAALVLLGAAAESMGQPMPAGVSLADIRADEQDRDQREKLPEIVRALRLKAGSVVADLGSGYGYYAVRFSPVVAPGGRVFAQEIDAPLLAALRRRLDNEHLTNVTLVLGKPDNPRLPKAALDALLIADVYHEIARPASVLPRLRRSLKPGGLVLVIDYLKPELLGHTRAEQAADHNIGPEFVEGDLKRAGFTVLERRESFGEGYDGIPVFYILASR